MGDFSTHLSSNKGIIIPVCKKNIRHSTKQVLRTEAQNRKMVLTKWENHGNCFVAKAK